MSISTREKIIVNNTKYYGACRIGFGSRENFLLVLYKTPSMSGDKDKDKVFYRTFGVTKYSNLQNTITLWLKDNNHIKIRSSQQVINQLLEELRSRHIKCVDY